jgi:hypothetical protein
MHSKWKESPTPLKRAPGCECTRVAGGVSTVLVGDGLPNAALPAMQCNCGRTSVQINTKRTFHRVE